MKAKRQYVYKARNLKGMIRDLVPAQYLESRVMPARINRIVSARVNLGMYETQLSSVKVQSAGYSPI
jgi:hypothetical protein